MNDTMNTKNTGTSTADMSLTHAERERMRGMLQAYMAMKPLRTETAQEATSAWHLSLFFSPRAIAALLVVAVFASSAGISYAAQSALPGDVLYAIKTNVNEPVQGALATSASAKAAWAIDVAGERVKEAAALAAAGKLSSSTQDALQQNFNDHAQVAADAISAEASSSPEVGAEAAVSVQAQLDEYNRILAQVGVAKNVNTAALSASLQQQSNHFASIRAQAESHLALASTTDIAVAAARTQKSARAQLDASFGLAQSTLHALASSSRMQVAAQLQGASTSLADGDTLLGTDSPGEALGAFQNSLSATEKLGVFLETSAAIHAHTGLLIAEPHDSDTSATTTPRSANKKKSTDRKHPIPPAATSSSASSTPPQTASDQNTPTTTNAPVIPHQTTSVSAPASPPPAAIVPVSIPVSAPAVLGL
jgi:hypothetical protein